MQDVRFGTVPPDLVVAKEARAELGNRLVSRSFASVSENANHKIQCIARASPEQSPAKLGPSMERRAGQKERTRTFWLLPFHRKASCCSFQNMGAALVHLAGLPNPSVNLTRNSVPHLPGMARYAHNALPGKRVTLPRAGYLKR
jgi:hypothetical protein